MKLLKIFACICLLVLIFFLFTSFFSKDKIKIEKVDWNYSKSEEVEKIFDVNESLEISRKSEQITLNEQDFIKFVIFDKEANCYPSGKVFVIGNNSFYLNLTKGEFRIERKEIDKIGKSFKIFATFNASECGFKDELIKNYRVYYLWDLNLLPEINNYNLTFSIKERNFNKPLYYAELPNYVRPQEVTWYYNQIKEKIKFTGIVYEDLYSIKKRFESEFRYLYDFDNVWLFPNQTLKEKYADCEDYSTTLLSLFKNYRANISCYNLLVKKHLTTLCKFREEDDDFDTIAIFDQGDTQLRENFYRAYNDYEKCRRVFRLIQNYYSAYGLSYPTSREKWIELAFDEKDVFYFENIDDFCEWIINVV